MVTELDSPMTESAYRAIKDSYRKHGPYILNMVSGLNETDPFISTIGLYPFTGCELVFTLRDEDDVASAYTLMRELLIRVLTKEIVCFNDPVDNIIVGHAVYFTTNGECEQDKDNYFPYLSDVLGIDTTELKVYQVSVARLSELFTLH